MTQREEILKYIEEFGSITPMEAYSELGITKLATRVGEMRKDGIAFKIEAVRRKNRNGRSVRFARYSLLEVSDV